MVRASALHAARATISVAYVGALVLLVLAAGRNPARTRRRGSRSPLSYLRSLQSSSGAVRYSRTSTQTPVWLTAQALTGLARRPFPIG